MPFTESLNSTCGVKICSDGIDKYYVYLDDQCIENETCSDSPHVNLSSEVMTTFLFFRFQNNAIKLDCNLGEV